MGASLAKLFYMERGSCKTFIYLGSAHHLLAKIGLEIMSTARILYSEESVLFFKFVGKEINS